MLSGPEIVKLLEQENFRVNKTSVYRALERLLEKAEVCRLSLGEQTVVYELRGHHHDHAVCTVCGKVLTLDCHVEESPSLPGFQVDHHHATYFGKCSTCVK